MKELWIIFLVLAAISCVEQIDFEAKDEIGILVVDGVFSTQADTHTIALSRTDILGKRVFNPESAATINIFNQSGAQATYTPVEDGVYLLPAEEMPAEIGGSYFIEIITADGRSYRSSPETITQVPIISSLTFEVSIEQVLVDEIRLLEKRFFSLFLSTTFPGDLDNLFLKWDVEHVFSVPEITCSPLSAPKTCYIYRPININEVQILESNILEPESTYSRRVVHQEIDHAFGVAASFRVSQTSLTRGAHEYWDNVNQISNNVGSIFDAPPAAIPGNITSLDDPGEQVLGYFSAVDESTKLIFVRRGDLPESFIELPLCGLPGLPPSPRDPACCNCLRLDHSSLRRPPYWP